jgi:FixJ family two-component response regulator
VGCKDVAISEPGSGKLAIVVVDDQLLVVNAIKRVLHVAGYESECFTDPTLALKHIEKETDLFALITDYNMPQMMGDEFIREVQKLHPELPCVVITGVATREVVTKLTTTVKVTRILSKPWNTNVLLEVLEKLKESHGRSLEELKVGAKDKGASRGK